MRGRAKRPRCRFDQFQASLGLAHARLDSPKTVDDASWTFTMSDQLCALFFVQFGYKAPDFRCRQTDMYTLRCSTA